MIVAAPDVDICFLQFLQILSENDDDRLSWCGSKNKTKQKNISKPTIKKKLYNRVKWNLHTRRWQSRRCHDEVWISEVVYPFLNQHLWSEFHTTEFTTLTHKHKRDVQRSARVSGKNKTIKLPGWKWLCPHSFFFFRSDNNTKWNTVKWIIFSDWTLPLTSRFLLSDFLLLLELSIESTWCQWNPQQLLFSN